MRFVMKTWDYECGEHWLYLSVRLVIVQPWALQITSDVKRFIKVVVPEPSADK